jgi:uncharacterized protein (TIGR01777 family)
LAWKTTQQLELKLHSVRNFAYALVFLALAWTEPRGIMAGLLLAVLAGELGITLWDFVEEDRTRHLPPSERVTHTLLTLNYGAFLGLLTPVLLGWMVEPSALGLSDHGWWTVVFTVAGLSVAPFGLRDLFAAKRLGRRAADNPVALVAGIPAEQRILITGGTGFIGGRLTAALVAAGHEVTVLTRSPAKAAALPAPLRVITSLDQIAADARIDVIINLAGEPISDRLWTERQRAAIVESRTGMTKDVVALIRRLDVRPEVLISGSAIGWYGLRDDEVLDEKSSFTNCFSHQICQLWEDEARQAEALGVRVVCLRIGLVLAGDGGMLARLLTPAEFGLGTTFGNGRHWMSWVHRDDLIRLIAHLIASPSVWGTVNGTAPNPVRNRDFVRELGRALHRPAFLSVPAAPLRWILGDFAKELLLSGQRVVPSAALASGFAFRFPELGPALRDIVDGR